MSNHLLSISDRRVLKVNAVSEVLSFDEDGVTMSVGDLLLTVSGSGLSVSNLSLENGEVTVCGVIDAVVYMEDGKKSKKGLGRLFGG